MPPPMITMVTPTVITPMTEAEVRMVSRLERVRKVSAVATPTTVSSTSTATSPRLRPPLLSSSPPQRLPADPASRAARSTRLRSSTAGTAVFGSGSAMHASLHHQVQHPALVQFGAGGLVHHPALGHDQHPVGQPEHL